jgi:hypothetical protein
LRNFLWENDLFPEFDVLELLLAASGECEEASVPAIFKFRCSARRNTISGVMLGTSPLCLIIKCCAQRSQIQWLEEGVECF